MIVNFVLTVTVFFKFDWLYGSTVETKNGLRMTYSYIHELTILGRYFYDGLSLPVIREIG